MEWAKRYRRVLASLGIFVFAVWVFLELADDAPEGDYLPVERKVMLAMRDPHDPGRGIGPWWVTEAARDITALGGAPVLTLLVLLVLGYLLLRRKPRSAVFVLCAVVGGTLLSSGLKSWFGRERPDVVPHLAEVTSASFPSGHSMLSSTVYLTLGALLARTAAKRREKSYLIAVALLLSFLVGLSRVFLGVHFPTDVMAGWAAGTAWAILCWNIALLLQRAAIIRSSTESRGGD